MQILFAFDDDRRIPDASREEQAEAAFGFINEKYLMLASDNEAYVYDPMHNYADELAFIDGAENPALIREIALNWNQNIQREFQRALDALIKQTPLGVEAKPEYLAAASTAIYDVKKAAMALDNDWYDFADRALLVTEHGYFTTILTEPERNLIVQHPEHFAVLTISIKS